ncbi:MAG: hypothetical protein U0869_17445 [Chloroflexota bacterium]
MATGQWLDQTCLVEHTYDYTLFSDAQRQGTSVRICRPAPDLCLVPMPVDGPSTTTCLAFMPNPYAFHKASSLLITQVPRGWQNLCLFPGQDYTGEPLMVDLTHRKLPYAMNLVLFNDGIGSVVVGGKAEHFPPCDPAPPGHERPEPALH